MFKRTTAVNKIGSLTKRKRVIQGGTSASKTYSILAILINKALKQSNLEISVVSESIPHLRRGALKDFIKIMVWIQRYKDDEFNKSTLTYRFANGSFIEFFSADQPDKLRGARRNILYLNEANNIDFESYYQMAIRTSDIIYIDFNPTAEFWAHTEVLTEEDSEFLKLTYLDNEALPDSIIKEIEANKEKAKTSKYWANWWQVYGLGNTGSIQGAVFENYEIVDFPAEARLLYYGCDFGFAKSKLAILGIYNYNGYIYLKEFIYDTNLTNQQGATKFKQLGYDTGIVFCDSAEPKSIEELKQAGIDAKPCGSKQDIKAYAIQKLNENTFYVDRNSLNLIRELQVYTYDDKTNQPKKSNEDHLIDALLYAVGTQNKYDGQYR